MGLFIPLFTELVTLLNNSIGELSSEMHGPHVLMVLCTP